MDQFHEEPGPVTKLPRAGSEAHILLKTSIPKVKKFLSLLQINLKIFKKAVLQVCLDWARWQIGHYFVLPLTEILGRYKRKKKTNSEHSGNPIKSGRLGDQDFFQWSWRADEEESLLGGSVTVRGGMSCSGGGGLSYRLLVNMSFL